MIKKMEGTKSVVRHRRIPPVLRNLLRDTSTPVLAYLAERHGLPRVPGLTKDALITRLLDHLSDDALHHLQDDLIAARYGSYPAKMLLKIALDAAAQHQMRAGQPRLNDIPPEEAALVEQGGRYWHFTMHGYDVILDLNRRCLACGCDYFRFAARRHALCKHIARALTLIPETYARETLIDLLVTRKYGGPDTPSWRFDSLKAA